MVEEGWINWQDSMVEEGKSLTSVLKIEPNGVLIMIAFIEDGKREDFSKEEHQITYKRLKE